MEKIEFSTEVKLGDKVIDSIEVAPMAFIDLVNLWDEMPAGGKPEVNLRRARFLRQVHFKSAGERITPDLAQISQLPITVAKDIIAKLDVGQGPSGKMLNDGDGVTNPAHYQLGTPFKMKDGKGKEISISELEFEAKTYGDVEEILASENELVKTVTLIRNLARPVEGSLTRLPGWAMDKLTTADGVSIMQLVLPRF